ncbi:MAG TPA: TraR/DksA C4-type zinc finger protein [Acidimicrobiales bacterium]|nr:TraR/DksA C4-type zinc finger protein [Acidimicrobiales bacterium]
MPSDAPPIDYRQLLEAEQQQLRAELAELGFGDGGGLTYDPNFADSSQVTAERGEAEVLAGQLQESLREVARALDRLEAGSYGRCEVCGEEIQPARLEAMPATRFCINHANRA